MASDPKPEALAGEISAVVSSAPMEASSGFGSTTVTSAIFITKPVISVSIAVAGTSKVVSAGVPVDVKARTTVPITTYITKTPGGGVARVTAPLVAGTAGAARPGLSAKVLSLAGGTLPAGYKLSPLTFSVANGKSGVVPLVITTSSGTGTTFSLASTSSGPFTTGTSAQPGPAVKKIKLEDGVAGPSSLPLKHPFNGTMLVKPEPGTSAAKRRRRTTEDGVKGLRYFATKVCDKVREKTVSVKLTTYNSVAEDLVQEYSDPSPTKSREELACEQKNIRRRVYDALNVLMAINVIQKERKQIRWVGLPRTLSEAGVLKKDSLMERRKALGHLRQRLFHSALQLVALKELVEDNKAKKAERLVKIKQEFQNQPGSHAKDIAIELAEYDESQHIDMPFLFLTCGNRCEIECSVSGDAKDFELRFSEPFKIIEDTEILRHVPLVRSLDKGPHSAEDLQRAIVLLPDFVKPRFAGLLLEHRERMQRLEESKRADLAIRAAAEADRVKHENEKIAMAVLMQSTVAIAPAPVKMDGVEEVSGGFPVMEESSVEPVRAAQIAALPTGSPVTLKPGYYIQISNAEREAEAEPEPVIKMEGIEMGSDGTVV